MLSETPTWCSYHCRWIVRRKGHVGRRSDLRRRLHAPSRLLTLGHRIGFKVLGARFAKFSIKFQKLDFSKIVTFDIARTPSHSPSYSIWDLPQCDPNFDFL